MLTTSDVSNLVKLETEFNAAVESRSAAREAANSADFRFHATLEVCEHAINLQQTLEKNRFHEGQEAYTPVHHMLMDMQRETQALYRHADAAYKDAHIAVKKSFYALQEARESGTIDAPQTHSDTDEIMLKDIS
jgi:hypothetical protein